MTSIVGKSLSPAIDGDQHNSFSYFSPFYGKDVIRVIDWFIKKVRTDSQLFDPGLL